MLSPYMLYPLVGCQVDMLVFKALNALRAHMQKQMAQASVPAPALTSHVLEFVRGAIAGWPSLSEDT